MTFSMEISDLTAQATIAFPLRNAVDRLEGALKAFPAEIYPDCTILISDNHSSDGTGDLAERLAGNDRRISVYHQDVDLGATGNFRFLAQKTETEFLLFRAHDDSSNDGFLQSALACLSKRKEAELVVPHITTFKNNRRPKWYQLDRFLTGKGSKQERPVRLPEQGYGTLENAHAMEAAWVYGLWKTDLIRSSIDKVLATYQHLYGWDILLLLDALLSGKIIGSPDSRFEQYFDQHRGRVERSEEEADQIRKDWIAAAQLIADQRGALVGENDDRVRRAIDMIFRKHIRL